MLLFIQPLVNVFAVIIGAFTLTFPLAHAPTPGPEGQARERCFALILGIVPR